MMRAILLAALAAASLPALAQPPRALFNGKNLEGWQPVGDGMWTVLPGGVLVGQRTPRKTFPQEWPLSRKTFGDWLNTQAWLYTVNEFDEYDLHLEYWLRSEGNSGISIRDTGRAKDAVVTPADFRKTPSKVAYEIQINNQYPDKNPSGSIYGIAEAKTGAQVDNQWNRMEIESRRDRIRVKINGVAVAEHPGLPDRPKVGPIGLQLHDQFSVCMFRNIRIRELRPAGKK